MLKIKLFKGFILIVLIFSVLSSAVAIRFINHRVIEEANAKTRRDLGSAWAVYESRMDNLETILRLAASKEVVADACEKGKWSDPALLGRLQRIRSSFNLDFMNLLDIEGKVVVRASAPENVGDYRLQDPAVSSALKGELKSCVSIMSRHELEKESIDLAERAYFVLEDTPHSRQSAKATENRGMVLVCAAPVMKGAQVKGVIVGGILVNRNTDLIDSIQDLVFKGEKHHGVDIGTATIFLGDSRIATTVRKVNGNRALGTRVSREVAERVLDNGMMWSGEAFVVNQLYLSAYDPIRDGKGDTVGMLYVGILKKPFSDLRRSMVIQFVFVSLVVLCTGLALAFFIADRLARPIHRLVEAANHMTDGNKPHSVPVDQACNETERLICAFNQMAASLYDREQNLKTINRSYMETVGFVAHELKSPVATMMNYVYLLKTLKLGDMTEKQQKAVKVIERNCNRLVEMVRHYLNLSRIENNEILPVFTTIDIGKEVVNPLVENLEAEIHEKKMSAEVKIDAGFEVEGDLNMMREIFENLIGNAVKYGKDGGKIIVEVASRNGSVEFSVANEGYGIAPDMLDQLFQKFTRLETDANARRQKGTGLGLFITKKLVEAHGGNIVARSEPDGWTVFEFTLPRFDREGQEV